MLAAQALRTAPYHPPTPRLSHSLTTPSRTHAQRQYSQRQKRRTPHRKALTKRQVLYNPRTPHPPPPPLFTINSNE
eukprot:CAMPEP_0172508716 /NCGR_PEP_ID=MMETSP1066-20121228/214211_1 /TAXON_ID=671091 /ORGANISM="Coscinodiscus wailesii, Strain CCMP2513" /LENGTH=75 /DNA_ID=CAMNT_0013286835 /DNA_START=60 /DNA_END=284 /DNA_ORIENTATION=+